MQRFIVIPIDDGKTDAEIADIIADIETLVIDGARAVRSRYELPFEEIEVERDRAADSDVQVYGAGGA